VKRIYNLKPSPPDPRDYKFQAPKSLFAGALPPSVDLSPHCSPVVDQGDLGACTGNALASGLREFMLLKSGKPLTRLSRLFVYYEERAAEGTTNEDAGANIKDGLDCLLKLGVCREELDPYNIATFTQAPTPAEVADAKNYKIGKYQRVNGVLGAKQVLASGSVLVAGMDVYQQFESDEAATTGIVRMPAFNEDPLGGHCVTVVGYTDTPLLQPGYWKGGGFFLVRNSWGTGWGLPDPPHRGYFKICYDYVNHGFMDELWMAT
jgi:C1A family cysteine protease